MRKPPQFYIDECDPRVVDYISKLESEHKELVNRLSSTTAVMKAHPDYIYATRPLASRHALRFLDEVTLNENTLYDIDKPLWKNLFRL